MSSEEAQVPLMSNGCCGGRVKKTEEISDVGQARKTSSRKQIGIIGTGNYAVALSRRLNLTGFDVILGSRRPGMRETSLSLMRDCVCGLELDTISECIRKCDVIFVAIHMEDFKVTLEKFVAETKDKILIDVSNREYRYAAKSNAEHLAFILPQASVVKAFNTISAFAMEDVSDSGMQKSIFVAGDDRQSRMKVSDLAKDMGFRTVDLGTLKSARFMEDFVLKVFPHWKIPIFMAFGVFNLWCLYIVYIYFIEKTAYSWEQLFLKVLNKPLCMTAITMLSMTYLPGQIASIFQVYYGTKHRRFPQILDTWLKSRKQLGLISFFLVSIHVLASVMMLSPTYYSSWFHKSTVSVPISAPSGVESAGAIVSNGTGLAWNPKHLPGYDPKTGTLTLPTSKAWMVWKGEMACIVGLSAFVLMSILTVTSIRSVGDSLNWSEWRCIQSKLGFFVLFLSVAHVCIMGGPWWVKGGFYKMMRSITFLSIILPCIVLLLKVVFSVPPLSGYLRKIQRGWEREGGKSRSCCGESSSSRNSPATSPKRFVTSPSALLPKSTDDHNVTIHDFHHDAESFQGVRLAKSCKCSSKGKGKSVQNGCCGEQCSLNVQCNCSSV